MSDETDNVPAAPVPPVQETPDSSETVTLKTPPSLLEKQEAPQSPAAAPEEVPPAPSAPEVPESPGEDEEGAEEVPDTPSLPVVETTPVGQTVTHPDGRVVYTRSSDAPISNSEWQQYELTHQGDQLRYPYVPGDKEYTPYSDPNVPNSQLAQQIEREIASYAERVLQNSSAEVSYIWNALHGVHVGELDTAIATGGWANKVMA